MKLVRTHKPALMDMFNPGFVNRFFNEAFSTEMEEMKSEPVHFRPGADILKTENGYELKLALPGISREEVKIEVEGQTLSISGERKNGHAETKGRMIQREITYGKFSRTFSLSSDIDTNGIQAEFRDGMLKVILPVAEKALPKTIDIRG